MKHDLYRYSGDTSFGSFLKFFFTHPGFRFVTIKRLCERFSVFNPLGLLGRLWYKRLQYKFGFQIPHTSKIAEGLFIGHFGNIVINQGVEIGANCNIAQGVTLGYVSRGNKKGCPVLGDRVWIGANSVIVGKISIGNDVLIAPLTLVNQDIPDRAVVAGNPGKVISFDGSMGYVNNILQ